MQVINRIKNLDATVICPASKAHTLRALFIGALAKGKTTIYNPLFAEDQLNVIKCLKRLGVKIEHNFEKIVINGVDGKFTPQSDKLDVGESGVGMNFLISAGCLSDKPVEISGTPRLNERPVREVVEGLRLLGGNIEYLSEEGFPPLKVCGPLKGGQTQLHGAKTSQYFSSISTFAPCADSDVAIHCLDDMTEKPYLDINLQMMEKFGAKTSNDNYKDIRISSSNKYTGREITIEGDYSSASFFFLAAAICNSRITVKGLADDTAQGDREFLDLIEKMGCSITAGGGEVVVQGAELSAIEYDMSGIPDLVPPIAVAAAFAKGTSKFTNIGHLRHKECDRLAVMALELNKMGVNAYCDDDSLTVEGCDNIHGAQICPHNDHRIAMSFGVAGLALDGQVIENPTCVAKSFPDFWERFAVFNQ